MVLVLLGVVSMILISFFSATWSFVCSCVGWFGSVVFSACGIPSWCVGITHTPKESSKFAKVMGITTEEVENMINTNPTEFFLQFSQILRWAP